MINAPINSKIFALWEKYFDAKSNVLAPIFYDGFNTGSVLFVGVNPSTNSRGLKKALRGTEYENSDIGNIQRWSAVAAKPALIDEIIAIGRHVIAEYGYFKKMHEIANAVGAPFQHLDLFVYRQTSQRDFLTYIRNGAEGADFNEFGIQQLAIFHAALISARPKVIVVANAFASQVLRTHFAEDISFDDERGFHWLTLDSRRVPIFFTSMLSGQRSLDNGSYERLLWHVRQAAKAIKSSN